MKKVLVYIFIVSVVFVIAGCRGSQKNKIVGYWEEVSYYEPGANTTFWQFYSGTSLVITSYNNGVLTDSSEFEYDIDGAVFSVFSLTGDDSDYTVASPDERGEFWIDVLNDESFKITKTKHPDGSTDAVYMRRELIKRE